jgi:hypothetical protein
MTMASSQVIIGRTLKFLNPWTCAVTALSQVTKARTSKPLYWRPHLKVGHTSKPFNLRVSMSLFIIVLPLSCITDLPDLFI